MLKPNSENFSLSKNQKPIRKGLAQIQIQPLDDDARIGEKAISLG